MKKLCVLLALVLVLAGCGTNQKEITPSGGTEITGNPWVSIDVFAVNDLHGKLVDTESQPGVDELSTYLQQMENTILLATGDMWQGASESNLTKGLIVTEWMNDLGFAAMTMGGHEYDWGEEWIRENNRVAEFPFLGINVFHRETDQRADYCESSVVVEIDGVQVGIIGAIGNCYYSIASDKREEIYFKTGAELTELVKAEAENLRSQGADFIIYAIHDGSQQTSSGTEAISVGKTELKDYYDMVLSDSYVDLVFEADTHYTYVLVDQHGVYHLQGGSNNSGLSHAKVLINRNTGEVSVAVAEVVSTKKYQALDDHPIVETLLEKYAEQITPAEQIVGVNGRYRNSYEICQLVADLYCRKGLEKWGAQYDIVLGGGYISCRSPGYLPEGQVQYSQLQSLLPFDNQITLCRIQGRDLISKFLETDNSAYYIKTTDYGENIRSQIDPDATYYVVTDSYSANYAYNRMTVVEVYAENIFARDLVAEYLAQSNN